MKRIMPLLLFALLTSIAAVAQSSEFVDSLLGKKAITVGQTAYLVLVASGNISEDADEARAFELLQNMGWAPAGSAVDKPIELSTYCYVLMRAFDIKGGIMYTLFPSPRYAYRELSSMEVIQGKNDPASPVDGNTAITVLSIIFE
ncbi:MAG: hypothetical protein WCL50_11005, partial [Spirochaetota bacterium]